MESRRKRSRGQIVKWICYALLGLGHQFLYHAHQQVSREHPAQPGGDHLVAFLRQGVARKVGQHAQAIGGVFGAAGDDAVVTGAGYHARRVEVGGGKAALAAAAGVSGRRV